MEAIRLPHGTYEYDPASPLGRKGGFGQVFAGRDVDGRDVAVKRLHLSVADAAHRELSIAEELRCRDLQHVLPFIDAGEDADGGQYFVVMPRAEGNLQEAVAVNGPLSPPDAAGVLREILAGLVEVGDLVHRDLKPENVLRHSGAWKLADFGIARFVESATSSNTLRNCLSPYYAAPEQWRMERSTRATDLYSLGCIGFFLLTGAPPFTDDPRRGHLESPMPELHCTDGRLKSLVTMLMRKVPDARPAAARARAVLEQCLARTTESVNSPAQVALEAIGASLAHQEQSKEALAAGENRVAQDRRSLFDTARGVLAENLDRLWEAVSTTAPAARRANKPPGEGLGIQLGQATLSVNVSSRPIDSGAFSRSGWDVLSSAVIEVSQHERSYVWSSSLWYAKLSENAGFRWHEVSYMTTPLAGGGPRCQPFACTDLGDADYAASPVMDSVQKAYGPTPVDDESEQEFHDRWIWLLAQAAAGQLQHPRYLPIKTWPPL